MKNYLKQDSETKVRILKPLLDDWNECIKDNWIIEKDGNRRCVIRRETPGEHEHLHGSLLSDIAGICNAYRWTFAVYCNEENGIYINV